MNNIGKVLTNEIDKVTRRPNPAITVIGKAGIGGGVMGLTAGFAFQALGDCYSSGKLEELPFGVGEYFTPPEIEGLTYMVA